MGTFPFPIPHGWFGLCFSHELKPTDVKKIRFCGRDLVVAVDHSFSMGYGGRWEQAVDAARRVIDGIGPEDRASLVMFDHQATAVTQPTSDRAALLATLGRQELGSGLTDYSVALRLAQQILADSDLPHREIVVISDFQRTGQDGQDEVRLAEGIRLTAVDLSTPEASNVAVASVSFITTSDRSSRSWSLNALMGFTSTANAGLSPTPRARARNSD